MLRELRKQLPDADFLYLGDNARAPYGSRSFETIYHFTLQAVEWLFAQGCPLVILACNTASAKALRTIQQNDLQRLDPTRRVLGVIRPTVEAVGALTRSGHIGIVGTPGTVASKSYDMEIAKLYPDFTVASHACPMWVPLIENREFEGPGADYFVKKDIDTLLGMDPAIDTIILGCTHYPLLIDKIRRVVPDGIAIVAQGDIVARSLADYLQRHPDMDTRISHFGTVRFCTTDRADRFADLASIFMGHDITSEQVEI